MESCSAPVVEDVCRCFVFALPSWFKKVRGNITTYKMKADRRMLGLTHSSTWTDIIPPQYGKLSVIPFARPCIVNLTPENVNLEVLYMQQDDAYITFLRPRHGIVFDRPRKDGCGAVVVVMANERAVTYLGHSVIDIDYPTANLVNDILRGEKVVLHNVVGSNDIFRIDPFTWKSVAEKRKTEPSTLFPKVSYLGAEADRKLVKFIDDNREHVTKRTSHNLLCKVFLGHAPNSLDDEALDPPTETMTIRLSKVNVQHFLSRNRQCVDQFDHYRSW